MPNVHTHAAAERLEDEQDPADVRSHETPPDGASYLECRRAAADGERQQTGGRGDVPGPARTGFDDARAAEGAGHRVPAYDSPKAHERPAPADDPRCGDPPQGGCSGDIRSSQEQIVQGSSPGVPGVGDEGSSRTGTRVFRGRFGESGYVREGEAHARGDGCVRPGDQSKSPAPRGELEQFGVGVALVRGVREQPADDREGGLPRGAGEGKRVRFSFDGEAQEEERDHGIPGQREEDGPGSAGRGSRGDQRAHDPVGGLEGQTRPVNDDGSTSESSDELTPEIGESFTTTSPVRDDRMEARTPDNSYECRKHPDGEEPSEISLEHFARDRHGQKDFSFSTCEKIVGRACLRAQALRKRTFQEGTESIALGAYSHGNHYGIIKKTYGLHQTTKYINAFMKYHGAKGQWSSFQLCHNCHVGAHRDAHNLVGTKGWTISFGDFSGGRLWLEHDQQSEVVDIDKSIEVKLSDGNPAKGKVLNTRENMISFCPKTRHAVEQWEGDRYSIVAYTTRGIQELSRTERDVLRTFGFPLGKREGHDHADRELLLRPKKSIRKAIWKGAQRASAFLTLGLAAASSFLSEFMPAGKSPGQACIFEIGGDMMTYQMLEAGAHVIEPISWDEYFGLDSKFDVQHTIRSLRPNVVWIQGDVSGVLQRDPVHRTIECQLGWGGTVVLQAPLQDPLWSSCALECLLQHHAHACEDHGDLRVLRLGHLPLYDDVKIDTEESRACEHTGFVASHNKRAPLDHDGASAIHFEGNVPDHVQAALKSTPKPGAPTYRRYAQASTICGSRRGRAQGMQEDALRSV